MRWFFLPALLVTVMLASTVARSAGDQSAEAAAQNAAAPPPPDAPVDAPQPFDVWLQALIAEARERGIREQVITEALVGLEPLHRVIQSDRTQAELNPGFAKYLSTRLTAPTIRQGREQATRHRALLQRIAREIGVQGRFLLAIWGLETRYGRITGSTPVFRALATLAWEPRRADFFRGELFNALMMVDRGYIDVRTMTGSWAGAMGQTQFMPSSYMKYAVDFDGDGHRDIWQSTPDALGSIASYLKGYGWNDEQTWGREVRVPAGARTRIAETVPRRTEGCYAIRNMTERIPLTQWQKLGVRRIDGGSLPAADIPAGLVDVGERMFLVYPNYDAILGYNCAHYYALSVALLADQIEASGPIAAAKPARRAARTKRQTPPRRARTTKRR